jgi:hypothetical protein
MLIFCYLFQPHTIHMCQRDVDKTFVKKKSGVPVKPSANICFCAFPRIVMFPLISVLIVNNHAS